MGYVYLSCKILEGTRSGSVLLVAPLTLPTGQIVAASRKRGCTEYAVGFGLAEGQRSAYSQVPKPGKIRLLHPQHLDGIWIGQDQYRLPLAPLNEFPERWC